MSLPGLKWGLKKSYFSQLEYVHIQFPIEEGGKGRRCCLRKECNQFNQFYAALAVLHWSALRNRMNSTFSSYHPGAIRPFLHIIRVQNS